MKRIFLKFMALFAAIAMIWGCDKNDLTPGADEQLQTITVAALSSDADSKVNITPNEGDSLGFKVDWEVNDRLIASSADGETYIATFKIQSTDDIASDGSAKFTALDASDTLTVGEEYKFYTSRSWNTNTSYNKEMTYPAGETWRDVDDKNFNVSAILHSPSPIEFGSESIVLEHFYSYIELTAELPSRSYDVRIRYHDSNNSIDYSYYYMTSGTSYAEPSSTFVFNAAIAPANLSASNSIIVDCTSDEGENYTELFRITSDKAFEAGKHYRIKKDAVTPPLVVGFSRDAVPIASMLIDPRTKKTVEAEIKWPDGISITNDDIDKLNSIMFYVGYDMTGSGFTAKYSKFKDVTWISSETEFGKLSKITYLELTPMSGGGLMIALKGGVTLPTSEKTVKITAKAPNGDTRSFNVHLLKEKIVGNAPTSVELDRNILVANIGAEMTLAATVLPDTTTTNKTLNWTSSDSSIASVDANGTVTTKSAGSATITATAQSGGKEASCIVRVNTATASGMYKIGDYYPNSLNPIGVVFMINSKHVGASANSGKIVSLDTFRAAFSTIDDREIGDDASNGYNNMRAVYQKDSDFSDYPAYQWVAEKNAVGYNYPDGAKGQWYIASDEELRHLMAGICDLIMIGKYDPLYDGFINDWGRNFAMSRDGKSYTPDITAFNKIITDKGGEAIWGTIMLSSTIDNNMVFALAPSNGRVGGASKSFETAVRAIMEF